MNVLEALALEEAEREAYWWAWRRLAYAAMKRLREQMEVETAA